MAPLDTAKMPIRTPELLAPAGDWEALRAAVANGADAVYFGLDQFNARHRASNFTLEQLPEVMAYLRGHNVKGVVTFNTLIFSGELPAAVEYLKAIAQAGVDAVIVQDLGISQLLHRLCPDLAIHASTQMTLTEPWGIDFVRQFGIQRIVLARELSLAEIAKITGATDLPIEVFVHGALCVSYSGQCLTSESLGGRSANRGQCAQACRLPYELIVDGQARDLGDKAYLLSPSDLAAYDLIGDLLRIGVASFKIEGRLKSAHYVAATCQTYRAALDAAAADLAENRSSRFQISAEQKHDLEQTFSRGFTHGFLGGINHQELVAARFPKARGTRVGTVLRTTTHGVIIQPATDGSPQTTPLKPGDGIVFDEGHPEQDEQGGRIFALRQIAAGLPAVRAPHRPTTPAQKTPPQLELEFRPGDINLSYINPGAIVWKTDDPAVKRRLEHSFSREIIVHRAPLDVTLYAHAGQFMSLRAEAEGHRAAARWEDKPLDAATKHPIAEALAREQLGRLGETPFELRHLTLDTDGRAMVPKSALNDLRRRVCEQLLRARQPGYPISDPDALEKLRGAVAATAPIENRQSQLEDLYLLVRTLDQLAAALAFTGPLRPAMLYVEFEDVRRYPEAVRLCRQANMPVGLASIRIVKPGEQGFLRQVSDCRPDAILVRSLGAVGYYRQNAPEIPLIGDYALNVANELTAAIFLREGLRRVVPSYDLNWQQLAAMAGRMDPSRLECVIHQHMPMFHMEHCVFAHTLSNGKDFHDCGRPCERHRVDLRDRVGENHPLLPDVGCRNTLFNAVAQTAAEYLPEMRRLGLRHFRVELLRESAEETTRLLERYARVLAGLEPPAKMLRSLRVLNQLGVTRGTLAHE
jgi:U32 family peptidase